MGEETNIAWCTSSWSPWIGCTEISPGCLNCYAKALDKRHKYGGKGRTHWGPGVPRYRTKSWHLPVAWNKKAEASGQRWTVFPSLCDPFDNEVPEQWREDLWELMTFTPALTWLLLTKRIGNVEKMDMLPLPNVWLGASIVNQEEADRDIPKLLATPAAKRFVSYEPALGPVDFSRYLAFAGTRELHWLICGGESDQGGKKARQFHIEWARDTIAQCKAAGVPVFCKQLGSNVAWGGCAGPDEHWPAGTLKNDTGHGYFRIMLKDRAGADPSEWPTDLRVQEQPL